MFTVLITAPTFAALGVELLVQGGCRILYAKNEEEIAHYLADEQVDAVISRTLPLRGSAIASCPTLKVISKHGAGYDNVDVAAATRSKIPVFYTPGANAQSVAELVFGLTIVVARSVTGHDRSLRTGEWNRAGAGLELSGRGLGIVGVGNVGRRVARLGAAFGMRVIGYDPYIPDAPCAMAASLDALLQMSQVLTLHVPLTAETHCMIGMKELGLLPRDAIVINTARGGVVDERALASALKSRAIYGAGFDVFESEPMPAAHPFQSLPNVVMTPHIGGSTRESLDAVAIQCVENVLTYLNRQIFNSALCVNPVVLAARP
jgi:D-3-phosphoglycerate dehydrogenase